MTCLKILPALVLLLGFAFAQHDHAMAALGKVDFHVSCTPEAQEHFNRALGLLHHMMYVQAEAEFAATAEIDPNCAMAHWGIAMTQFQPLWPGQPSQEALQRGREAIELAKSLHPQTERERAFIAALEGFYQDPEADYGSRLQAFEKGMGSLYSSHGDDIDAAAFYALSLLATAPATDKSLSHQKQAAGILASILAQEPTHPGGVHYSIHAHDFPPLAQEATEIARSYDQIAPEVPHALHMPSHIFVRLGEWEDTISWNLRSAEAALKLEGDGPLSLHYPHGMDYAMYGYLQLAKDEEALKVLEEVGSKSYQDTFAAAYALAAIPARYALERRQWQEAATLTPREPSSITWDNFPEIEALTHFARGIGAARSGDVATAQEALETLEALQQTTAEAGRAYWAEQIEIQRLAVAAWLAYAQGNDEEALTLIQASADLEDATEKHIVTPGALLPARELFGDLLLELNRPTEALAAYEASLGPSPNHLNVFWGAPRAAELAGDAEKASFYHARVVEMTGITREVHHVR
jgi:tetratricopeptide (TPR) repeat protein